MTQSIFDEVAAVGRIDVVPKILEVICRTTGMGFAAVARVTEDRWIACAVRDEIGFGLAPYGELPVATTLCHEVRGGGQAIVIDHVAEDAVFRDHPAPAMYGFQSYVSVPIRHKGEFFGALCAIDPSPRSLTRVENIGMFELFADLIAAHLDTETRLADSAAALIDAQAAAEIRDQFIAVLGHDLRNPLAAIEGGARLLRKTPLNEQAMALVGHVEDATRRMAGLIDNVLDFARGRLGGGFAVDIRPEPDLANVLRRVVHELRTAHPDRAVDATFDLKTAVDCDSPRIAQLLSNLLGNAFVHGAAAAPVRVSARTVGQVFELTVANAGEPIPHAALKRLFHPFSRASLRPHQQGLGLGLYISSEIAKAHGGVLEVASDPGETRFTFRMPVSRTPLVEDHRP
jgi:signal transduction histidine kinase